MGGEIAGREGSRERGTGGGEGKGGAREGVSVTRWVRGRGGRGGDE